jgi:hypothetical protein
MNAGNQKTPTMRIDRKTQRKIEELRRLAALPSPEPADRFVQRIMDSFFDALKRHDDLDKLREDFDGIALPPAD